MTSRSAKKAFDVPLARCAVAFTNPVDEQKVEKYRARFLHGSQPPPIKVYTRVVDESDIDRLEFLDRVAEESDVGLPVHYIRDGYHRAFALLGLSKTIRAIDIEK